MICMRPFKAYRPVEAYVKEVADLPYDVVTDEEVSHILKRRPYSFLGVDKPEAWCDQKDDKSIARAAKEALERLIAEGVLKQEAQESFYIYGLESKASKQYGVVGCFSCKQYEQGVIKKHEKTRVDKEKNRLEHIAACEAHTGPIFLTCKEDELLQQWIRQSITQENLLYDFEDERGIRQVVYSICDKEHLEEGMACFRSIEALYVADGHHRLQAAATYAKQQREQKEGQEDGLEAEYEYFLGVVFPKSELIILDYNRVLKDESGLSEEALMHKLAHDFDISEEGDLFKPTQRHTFGMRYKKKWYGLKMKKTSIHETDVVERLDTWILQNKILEPIFHIQDPRTDKRIDFIGGIKGIDHLNYLTNTQWDLAFSLYPTSIEELIDVADAGEMMPPKSTWFEPKLRSGLLIHKF